MSQSMIIWEKIGENKIRSEAAISKNQLGFMPGKLSMKTLFCIGQLVKKYRK